MSKYSATAVNNAIHRAVKDYNDKEEMEAQKEAEDIDEVFDEIQSSPVMENLWKAYQRNYSYADDLFWHTVMDAIRVLYQTVYAERNGTHD